jgi:hypothetical protein
MKTYRIKIEKDIKIGSVSFQRGIKILDTREYHIPVPSWVIPHDILEHTVIPPC